MKHTTSLEGQRRLTYKGDSNGMSVAIDKIVHEVIAPICIAMLFGSVLLGCGKARSVVELHRAAEEGNVPLVKRLIEDGANVNWHNRSGTPLHRAALNGHFDVVRLLIQNGADVNWENSAGRALHMAALSGHIEVARILIVNGADVNATITDSPAAVFRKASLEAKNRTEPVSKAFGASALHFAVSTNDKELVTLLITSEADVNAVLTLGPDWKNRYLRTPLQLAPDTAMAALLKQSGAMEKPFADKRRN